MKYLILLIAIHSILQTQAQYTLEKEITIPHNSFEIDHMGGLYIVQQGTLIKLNANGKIQKQYSDSHQMSITKVDVLDPMNILVYFEQDNRVVFLDNMLNEVASPIFLDNYDVNESCETAKSVHHNFWFFDPYELRLFAVGRNGKKQTESKDISHFANEPYAPNTIIESGDKLYVNVPSTGILVFDTNGAFITQLNYPELQENSIQVVANQLYLKVSSTLLVVNPTTYSKKIIHLPNNFSSVRIAGKTLICSDGKTLKYFKQERNKIELDPNSKSDKQEKQ